MDPFKESAVSRFGGNRALYEKALVSFARELPDTWRSFEDIRADTEASRQFVHKIKGAAGNLGEDGIYRLALDLETSIKNGAPDAALYAGFCAACAAFKKNTLPDTAAPAPGDGKPDGTREAFYDALYKMREALGDYDMKACSDALARLSGSNWRVSEDTAEKLKQLYRLIESYEYDEAITLLDDM